MCPHPGDVPLLPAHAGPLNISEQQRSLAYMDAPHPFSVETSYACSVSICLVKSSRAVFPPRRLAVATSKTHCPEAKGACPAMPPDPILCCSEFSAGPAAVSEGSCHSCHQPVLSCCSQLHPEKQSFVTFVARRRPHGYSVKGNWCLLQSYSQCRLPLPTCLSPCYLPQSGTRLSEEVGLAPAGRGWVLIKSMAI